MNSLHMHDQLGYVQIAPNSQSINRGKRALRCINA